MLTHFFSGATFPGGVFVFAAAPRGRSLTHCGPGRRCLPPGWCSFFAAAPPGPGWCFFFLLWPRPDAHSLTVGWGDFGKALVFFFFLLRPRRTRRANNKKCLVYYIGSKKTRRGHSKKNTTSEAVEEGSPEFGVWEREGKRLSWLCFVCSFLASTAEFIVQFLRRFKLPA